MLKKGTKVYTAFDEYVVEGQIGQGGNGSVFKVRNSNNKCFALKAINRKTTTKETLKRFTNEICFCERADNQHIIKILDKGAFEDSIVFYIMPLYSRTLREWMNKGINPSECLSIVTQILEGLKYAHEKGVWHRDIKPENILVDGNGTIVIADFGIAHFSEGEIQTVIETKPSDKLANFQYAAPEQRERGKTVDGRADSYALGLIINEMFTHEMPLGVNYKRIGAVCSDYSFLDSVVDRMLEHDIENRLYPMNHVARDILVAQKDWEQSQELLRITEEEPSDDSPYQISQITISDCKYEDGCIEFILSGIDDLSHFDEWFYILQSGEYNHTSIWGFGPARLRKRGLNRVCMDISSISDNQISSLIKDFKDWIEPSKNIFNNKLRMDFECEKRKAEAQRNAEIQRLKKEKEMRKMIRDLFDNQV